MSVVQGRTDYTPRLVLALIEKLPEGSAFVASVRGNRSWLGWDRQSAILADVYDAIMNDASINAADYAHARRVKPLGQPYPRPTKGPERTGQRVSDVRRALGGVTRPDLVAPPSHAIPAA